MAYDLSRLDERRFEDLCRALAVHVLGPGLQVFGAGPDGGREAAFDGLVPYPNTENGWDGYGVVQAKCRQPEMGGSDVQWLSRTITRELKQWDDPKFVRARDGRRPEYLIIATNVRLTSVARRGGIDRVQKLLADHAERLGLKGWDLWDANKLSAYLNAYPDVAMRFAEFLTSGQVLARAIDTIGDINAALAGRRLTVGQGQPGCVRAFEQAYRAAGGSAVLGKPASEVYDDGPGWVQQFTGVPGRSQGSLGGMEMMLCARFNQPAIAVTAELWDVVRAAGGIGQLAAVGYPVVTADTPRLLSTATGEVLLDGGDWRAGRLVRQLDGGWRWKPQLAFSFEAGTRDWHTSGTDLMDLRLRCATVMSWADIASFAIDSTGRRRLLAALRAGPLNPVIAALAARFSLDTDAGSARWERAPETEGHNDNRFASYRQLVPAVQGPPALGVWARFQLPDGLRNTVVAIVDLRVDFSALPGRIAGPDHSLVDPAQRLDLAMVRRCFAALWLTASQALPLVATADPFAVTPAGPSRVELHMATERPWAGPGGRVVGLLDMLDLAELGLPPAQPKPWMSTTVTTPLDLSTAEVDALVEQTLQQMASGFGFLEPDDDV